MRGRSDPYCHLITPIVNTPTNTSQLAFTTSAILTIVSGPENVGRWIIGISLPPVSNFREPEDVVRAEIGREMKADRDSQLVGEHVGKP